MFQKHHLSGCEAAAFPAAGWMTSRCLRPSKSLTRSTCPSANADLTLDEDTCSAQLF
jgi:hypothetical protein